MHYDIFTVIGLMSGTSMDGVDAALLKTDGLQYLETGPFLTLPYDDAFQRDLRNLIASRQEHRATERALTHYHVRAVAALLSLASLSSSDIDFVGFHGHTIHHDPENGRTWQIGDGPDLARELGIDVVYNFRANDVALGGQGAPLAPVYHRVLAAGFERPLAVLNIGGVANVTWIGPGDFNLIAFDTGPGNALIDDWVAPHTDNRFDDGGRIATAGVASPERLSALMAHPYFSAEIPKSLDRRTFSCAAAKAVEGLSVQDGAALLTAFTVECIKVSVHHLPSPPQRWIVIGGGRHNTAIMTGLARRLECEVISGEDVGWFGDAVEAQAFGYLAARHLLGEMISYPQTTGVPYPASGGILATVPKAE